MGAVHAADSGIVSSDIVGYATQDIAGGKLSCVAFQFADVGSATENASIASLSTSGLTAGVYDTMNTDAPCIMIYDGDGGYYYYYYISDAYDADGNETKVHVNPFTRLVQFEKPAERTADTADKRRDLPCLEDAGINLKDVKTGNWVAVKKFNTETKTAEAADIVVVKE